jgi:alkylated DNA repair dioxygenase AlkB
MCAQDLACRVTGERFNSCLLNLYRDGADYVGWHADDETAYGPNATICSISLGEARDFQLRNKADHKQKLEYKLSGGDLFVMKGAQHALFRPCLAATCPACLTPVPLTSLHLLSEHAHVAT